MWASDRMIAFFSILVGLIIAAFLWIINHYKVNISMVVSSLPLIIFGLLYAVRGYPVNIGLAYGRNKEREKVYELIEELDKWLEEHPEEK